ncbi:MAG: zinc-ribbon domain-containing protein [Lachnospiraceae bacterium]|nr:zinc-ribbon domain-containing protein [Lachnospiraceae bacterium]
MSEKICPSCGASMKEDAKFCPECGAPAPDQVLYDASDPNPQPMPEQPAQPDSTVPYTSQNQQPSSGQNGPQAEQNFSQNGPQAQQNFSQNGPQAQQNFSQNGPQNQQPYYQPKAPDHRGKKGAFPVLALISLICGILAFIFGFTQQAFGIVAGIAAIVLGIIALALKQRLKVLSIAGIVCGVLGFLISLLIIIALILGSSLLSDYGDSSWNTLNPVESNDGSNPALHDFGPGPASMPSGLTDSSLEESGADISDDSTDDSSEDTDDEYVLKNIQSLPTISETVLLDQNGIKITATGIDDSEMYMGPSVEVSIENNTDKDISIMSSSAGVNGYLVDCLLSTDVSAGKKGNDKMYLYLDSLNLSGVKNIGLIETHFQIYDPSTFDVLLEADGAPLQTSDYAQMDTSEDDSGVVLADKDGLFAAARSIGSDEMGTYLICFVKNSTDKTVEAMPESLSVNGVMVNTYYSETLPSGKMRVSKLYLEKSDLEKAGISSITDLELQMEFYDEETYDVVLETAKVPMTVGSDQTLAAASASSS